VKVDGAADDGEKGWFTEHYREWQRDFELAADVGDMGQRDRRVVGKVLASFAATRGPIMPRDWLAVSWSIWRTNVTTRQRPVTFDWRQ
jgi:hypothetical protein